MPGITIIIGERLDSFVQYGSKLGSSSPNVIDLYCGTYGHRLIDCAVLSLESIADHSAAHAVSKHGIFETLVKAYEKKHIDETFFVAASLACRSTIDDKFIDAVMTSEGATISVSSEAEKILMSIAARVALFKIYNHDDPDNISEVDLHRNLFALVKADIRIMSSRHYSEYPDWANVLSTDNFQYHLAIPALGIIPNTLDTCYSAAVLTTILTIPAVISMLAKRQYDDPMMVHLQMYMWGLVTGGYSNEDWECLNRSFISLPQFIQFGKGAEDAADFFTVFLDALKLKCPELHEKIHAMFLMQGLVQTPKTIETPNNIDVRLTFDIDETSSKNDTSTRMVPNFEEKIFTCSSRPKIDPIYNDRDGNCLGTMSDIFKNMIKDTRPEILVVKHGLKLDDPSRLELRCTISLEDAVYSLHGLVLYDVTHTDGHYISSLVSNTSMYFYDPQFRKISENPLCYRPRLLVYVKI